MSSVDSVVSGLAHAVGQVIKIITFPVRFVFNRVVSVISSVVSYLRGDSQVGSGGVSTANQTRLDKRKTTPLKTFEFEAIQPLILELQSLMEGQTDFFEQQRENGLFDIKDGDELFRWCIGRTYGDDNDSLKKSFDDFWKKLPDGNAKKITNINLEQMGNLALMTEAVLLRIMDGDGKTTIYPKTKAFVDMNYERAYQIRCDIDKLLGKPVST